MKRRLTTLALTALAVVALIGVGLTVVTPAHAGGPPEHARGATQIEGIGFFAEEGECVDPEGAGADFANKMTGDLEGCLYVFVETYECRPSGVYKETGTETYVGEGGTFSTTYLFTAKYDDCPNLAGQKVGRCQHPIVAGSGTGSYQGITGRLDFKDDIEAGNFPFRGHLRW